MIKIVYHKLKNYRKRKKLMKGFVADFETFKKSNDGRFELDHANDFPCLHDKTEYTEFDAHYVYHPAWAFRVLKQINPVKHVDIASTLHFCSMISAYIPTEFYDYRPAQLNLDGLISGRADLINLPFGDNTIQSLSCMHTIEHIGLGRYGDPIDPEGDMKAIKELKRVVAPGGSLLFVVPTGKKKLMFNAHRIYAFDQVRSYFDGFELKEFSLVTDKHEFIRNADPKIADEQTYGCGCYWFVKK